MLSGTDDAVYPLGNDILKVFAKDHMIVIQEG